MNRIFKVFNYIIMQEIIILYGYTMYVIYNLVK